MDRAVILYHSFGEDFVELLDHYISFFPEAKRYTFFGPGYILLVHEETRWDPCSHDPRKREPYWYVVYASSTDEDAGSLFARLMPYPLDYVGFSRHAKDTKRAMRLLPTARLLKLLNRHGLKTKETETASSTTAPTTASSSSGPPADQAGEESRSCGESDSGPTDQEDNACHGHP